MYVSVCICIYICSLCVFSFAFQLYICLIPGFAFPYFITFFPLDACLFSIGEKKLFQFEWVEWVGRWK